MGKGEKEVIGRGGQGSCVVMWRGRVGKVRNFMKIFAGMEERMGG